MPCDSVQISTVVLEKMNPETLKAAGLGDMLDHWGSIEIAGRVHSVRYSGGKLEVYGAPQAVANQVAAEIKKRYTATTLAIQAKRFGWQVRKISDTKLELIRR